MRCVVVVDAPRHHPTGDAAPQDHHVDELVARVARLAPARPERLVGEDLPSRLEHLARILEEANGPTLIVDASFVGHDSPLVDVLADPHPGSSVLTGVQGGSWPVRVVEGVVVSAGSPFHVVGQPTLAAGQGAGGVLRVAHPDRARMAAAAHEMAGVARAQGWRTGALVPLVLVALTRSGVGVHAVPAGGFVAVVAGTHDELSRARATVSRVDEHRTRLIRAARQADGFYSTFVVRRLSRPTTALAIRLGLTPNQVTLISLAIAAAAAGCFAAGTRWSLVTGALLLQVSLVVDCVDGELARYTRLHSALGAWLDAGTDRVKEFGVYAALAVGAARTGDELWLLAGAVLAFQTTRHFVDFGFAVRQAQRSAQATAPPRIPPATPSDGFDTPERPADQARRSAQRLGRSAAELSERTNRVDALVWAKRVVIMPIGERWLVISVATALAGPRLALGLLLGLGTLACLYTTAGRVLRSIADDVRLGRRAVDLVVLTDPGLVSRWLPVGASAGRFGWLTPAIARAVEYGAVLAAATLAQAPYPLTYAYLFVLTLWHYDAVYRLRHTGEGPPVAAQHASLGVVVRTLIVLVGAAAGPTALSGVLVLLGALVLAVTLVDSSRTWRTWLARQAQGFSVPRFRVVQAS